MAAFRSVQAAPAAAGNTRGGASSSSQPLEPQPGAVEAAASGPPTELQTAMAQRAARLAAERDAALTGQTAALEDAKGGREDGRGFRSDSDSTPIRFPDLIPIWFRFRV